MKRKKTDNADTGTLFIVSTPIGNLEDITLRALKILNHVDIIAAENVKHTKGLLKHYEIRTGLISYNQHNHRSRAPELLKRLKTGRNIALVTNAGTPALSDPGALLVKMAVDEGLKVSPVPGASAALAALASCGLRVDKFLFIGFLSSKPGKRKKELKELEKDTRTIIFYEAPHRIKSFLMLINEIFGNRYIVVCRELTKAFEEIIRGKVRDIIEQFSIRELKGEFTVVIQGHDPVKSGDELSQDITGVINSMLGKKDAGVKDIATRVSEKYNKPYRAVYKKVLDLKRKVSS
jgi:16S rRNA (cytidine1402-2'-O)-methyltransferase